MPASTRFLLLPFGAEFGTATFPGLTLVNSTVQTPVLAYDGTTAESAYWTIVAPQLMVGDWSCTLTCIFPTATSGTAIMDVAVQAITTGDALNIITTNSFDTTNTSTTITAPGTVGNVVQNTVTLTNVDSIAIADYVRVRISRAPTNGSDTIATDLYLVCAELRDGN